VQDAVLRAYRAFDGIRGTDIKPWLLAIVRNCCRNAGTVAKRHAHAPLPGPDDPALIADGSDPEQAAVQTSENRKLNAVVALLPDEFRDVLILREIEDMSYREIAEALEIPVGTVMSRLARARTMLKQKWMAEERA
jgi:RNA polymerase sigma-70 factor (ECF subfamily)